MVEDEIEHKADPGVPECGGEPGQVLDRPQVRADGAEISNGVAAIAVGVPREEDRHEVQIAHAELMEIVDVAGASRERSGKAIGIGGVADHRR